MNTLAWAQAGVLLLGVLHAAAAYAYFSRSRHALAWAAGWLVLSGAAAWLLPARPAWALLPFAGAVLLWTVWWASIRALPGRRWVPENAHQATGEIEGRFATLHQVRDFAWRSRHDFDARWEPAVRVDLEALEAVDLFVCTWGDPRIAHLIVSFVFRDDPVAGGEGGAGAMSPIAFSIETRRETDESWSGLAGFMKAFELIVIAAREGDVIRVRTNVRGETVRRFRLRTTPGMRRRLFEGYVREMNALAHRPRFYNTIFANCTTEVARIVRATGRRLPWSWPIVVSGYVPRYFHAKGLIDPSRHFAEIEAEADIGERARAEPSARPFSQRIREPARPG